jgi:hypothetical protein
VLKVLGVLWGVGSAYLLYCVWQLWFMTQRLYPGILVKDPELRAQVTREATFYIITGTLSVVVAFGMFRPRKFTLWLALLLCPVIGWWCYSELPGLPFAGGMRRLLIILAGLGLYSFTFLDLLFPIRRALFGVGQRPTKRPSDLPLR